MLFQLLQIFDRECSQFRSPEPAAEQDGNDGLVAFSAQAAVVEDLKQSPALFSRQPIPDPHAKLLRALDVSDACGKIGAEEPSVGGPIRQSAHGCEPKINGRRTVAGLLEEDPVPGHHGFVEGKPGFGTVPFDELVDGVIVGPLGAKGCQTVQNRRSGLLKMGQSQDCFRLALAFVFRHSPQSARSGAGPRPMVRYTEMLGHRGHPMNRCNPSLRLYFRQGTATRLMAPGWCWWLLPLSNRAPATHFSTEST